MVGLRDRPAPVRPVRRRAGATSQSALPRVFIAGDACHTHSPKAGPGHERLDAGRLQSRLEARRGAARALPAAAAAHLFGGTPGHRQGTDRLRSRMGASVQRLGVEIDADSEGVDPAETQSYFVRHGRYTAGTATHYSPVAPHRRADLSASRQRPGDRHALSFRAGHPPGRRQAGAARPHQSRRTAAGASSPLPPRKIPPRRLPPSGALCDFLAEAPQSPVRRYTPAGRGYRLA